MNTKMVLQDQSNLLASSELRTSFSARRPASHRTLASSLSFKVRFNLTICAEDSAIQIDQHQRLKNNSSLRQVGASHLSSSHHEPPPQCHGALVHFVNL